MYLKTKIECIRDRSTLFFQKIYLNVHNTLLDILYSTIIVKDINECSISNGGCEEIYTNTNITSTLFISIWYRYCYRVLFILCSWDM